MLAGSMATPVLLRLIRLRLQLWLMQLHAGRSSTAVVLHPAPAGQRTSLWLKQQQQQQQRDTRQRQHTVSTLLAAMR